MSETKLRPRSIIIIIIERKDLGGVMSKRLQGHLTTLKQLAVLIINAKKSTRRTSYTRLLQYNLNVIFIKQITR